MATVTVDTTSKAVRDLFNKGFTALERGNVDYAIDLLTRCVETEPGFERAWKFLRAAEIKRIREHPPGQIVAKLGDLQRLPVLLKARGHLKAGRHQEALFAAERLLSRDPLNLTYVRLFCDAALALDMPPIALVTFEALREQMPDDPRVLDLVGTLYAEVGYSRGARECFEQLAVIRPNDGEAMKKLKDAMALDSMSSGGWTEAARKKGSFHEMLRDQGEAVQLERQAKSVKSEQDIESLVADAEKRIEEDPNNVNHYRTLAGLYADAKQFNQAAEVLERAVKMNPGDGELDRSLSRMRLREFDQRIEAARASGDEDAAVNLENEKIRFRFEDLQSRVERYPNDLDLRFDWGVMLYENEHVNEAIQQFQTAQRNPKVRVRALHYLGLCFKSKGQLDLAVDQLRKAAGELLTMDATKKDVLYELGVIHEQLGRKDEAAAFFKDIYQVDIGFRDVAEKVESVYR